MRAKTAGYWFILFAILYGFLELWSAIGLRILQEIRDVDFAPFPVELIETHHRSQLQRLMDGRTEYTIYDRDLGWTIKPGGKSPLERANSQGIRADREYSLQPPPGKTRIAAFGDSFTHASHVANPDTWEEVIGREDASLEVLNFGVGGYGLDQAFLRYLHEGHRYQPHIVLIGYMTDDLDRHISSFRPFAQPLTGMPLAKPRFLLDGDRLALAPNPMQSVEAYRALLESPGETLERLGEHDARYQHAYRAGPADFLPSVRLAKTLVQYSRFPGDALYIGGEYNTASEAYQVTERIFDEFVSAVLTRGALPVIVIFPNRSDLRDYRRNGRREYAPLLRHFERRGYLYIDALHAFDGDAEKFTLQDIFKGHYTPLGNRLVGLHILRVLAERGALDRDSRQRATEQLRAAR